MFIKKIFFVFSLAFCFALTAQEGQEQETMEAPVAQPQVETPAPAPVEPSEAPTAAQPRTLPEEPSVRDEAAPIKEEALEPLQNGLSDDAESDDQIEPLLEEVDDEETEEKDSSRWDRHRKDSSRWDRYRHDRRGGFEFGIHFGFTREHYILAPTQRVLIFERTVEIAPRISVFIETVNRVDAECLFPSEGFFTMLIPVDEVFDEVLADAREQDALCNTLKQYIVPEIIAFERIQGAESFTTLAGTTIEAENKNGGFFINGVKVIQPYAVQDKGVIVHILGDDL